MLRHEPPSDHLDRSGFRAAPAGRAGGWPRRCGGCAVSACALRSTCFWCGLAITVAREPSSAERYETSVEARRERLERSLSARRCADDIDRVVERAMRERFVAGACFCPNELVGATGMNPCAIKYSLERLAVRGIVAADGQVRVRSNRWRVRWRLLAISSR